MTELSECIVTAGPGVSITCEQREDGAIALLITHDSNSPGEIQKHSGFGQDASWRFSEKRAVSSNKIVFRFPQGGNSRSKRSMDRQDLTERIKKGWPKRVERIEQNGASWLVNACLFFGSFEFASAEQWSSHNLDSAEPEIKRERGPWHRVNLARRLDERLQAARRENPYYSELNCRRAMLAEIYPDFDESDEKKRAYQKRFQRRINHGRVESKLLGISAALLLTVAPILNYDDLECLSHSWEDSWLPQEVIDASKKYEQLAVVLLFYLDQIGKCSGALLQRSIHVLSTITWNLNGPPIRLSQEGLIKVNVMPIGETRRAVFRFYVDSICNGRTILSDNIYRQVLKIAKINNSTLYALLALSASYYKEYLTDNSPERSEVENIERICLIQAFNSLPPPGPTRDASLMLLIHHAILNPNCHKNHWTQYLYQLQHHPEQQMNVVIAAHSVWLMAVLPLHDRYDFQKFDYDWLGWDCPNLYMVNSILGLSRKMLHFQYIITKAAKTQQTPSCQSDFLKEIDESPQLLHEEDLQNPLVRTVATTTMEAYRLATRLYACGRLYRLFPTNPIIKQDTKLLVGHLESLPIEGEGYSGIHPAFCFIIACICIEEVEDFAKLHGIFERIGLANKSNVLGLCKLLTWIWHWKITSRTWREDWWEEQANMIDSKMNGKPICVT
ncbi:hypothetical protein, variant 2 [Verruconis gallopava]|uniref:Transcription factor domain-containing protein n=1 Tax=Verruconis gallopava TaxID=253628 RepID=A0A0D1ZUX4_9PEZI|nr:uncharacterized protein PV09_09835 [Verruconis gallopava]XP_016208191.1 hypothetical protein, variant 1 [Verruconis gallopava]XP_016208192.1 hypothetical protein, variant 2 [Verruconis gallopava]KIV98320.1 hypothetical protein PV09_09835 [Verruconis gallopava]KIV98321.1 hypothetical protein, variant 1 [Verruconis gallopava]KIV98322.1 hypothetical protein, variant 2 [Verruconis gallopava]